MDIQPIDNQNQKDIKFELESLLSRKRAQKEIDLNDATGGFWIFKGKLLQQCANKYTFVITYGLLGLLSLASSNYYNGTISTMEKHYKISTKTIGIVIIGTDVSQMSSLILSYYAGLGHRPRWLSLSAICFLLYCLLSIVPIFLVDSDIAIDDNIFKNTTNDVYNMCYNNIKCEKDEATVLVVIILFIANIISGIGTVIYYTIGFSYMDDNIEKSKTPMLLSVAFFIRILGSSAGYSLASFCLKYYIYPFTEIDIDNTDPRWIGAWWLGWIILSVPLLIISFVLSLFPKILPETLKRKQKNNEEIVRPKRSLQHFFQSLKRIVSNRVFLFNTLACMYYIISRMAYVIYLPKYIEVQFHKSSTVANFVTGSIGFVSFALGILAGGSVVTKLKPNGRTLATFNLCASSLTIMLLISYAFLGCGNDNTSSIRLNNNQNETTNRSCNNDCNCDYVKYSPVCSESGQTYISACHAGCREHTKYLNGSVEYSECSCIINNNETDTEEWGIAKKGPCSVDCQYNFYIFIIVLCTIKFIFSSESVANFLIMARSVSEEDKSLAFGFSETLYAVFSFLPTPVLFGYIIDQTCLVWGETCTGKGNCWLYDSTRLRYVMNFTAATFTFIGTLHDVVVWYYSKNLVIFDEDETKEKTEEN